MNSRRLAKQMSRLIAGASLLLIMGCNKQPSAAENGAAAEAPPIAALPLAAAAVAPATPAPTGSALPPPAQPLSYAPPPSRERYRYIDRAYWMGDAFADTPPDYTVDYQGTRPWIWRAGDGAYRIVERLPRGERIYYYDAGQDQPFLVRDPDYSYAYDHGRLVGVYGPDGAELDPAMAARRTDEASRYYDRSRELYRAAQYQPRQAAYASEWTARRDDLRADHQRWQEQQSSNPDWRAWRDSHQAQDTQQWQQERAQRLAYAAAIGIPAASSGSLPSADELARRQAAYFSNRNGQAHGRTEVASQSVPSGASRGPATPPPPVVKGPGAAAPNPAAEAKAGEAKAAQMAQAEQAAADAKRKEAAAAQAKAVQSGQAQQRAAEAQRQEAAIAEAKSAQAAQAQKAAMEARQKETAAAQVKAGEAARAQRAAALGKQQEAAAAKAKAADAQKAAAEARQKEAAAAQAKSAQMAQAQKASAEARQHEAAAAQAKAEQGAKAPKTVAQAPSKPSGPTAKPAQYGPKGKGEQKKDHQPPQQQ